MLESPADWLDFEVGGPVPVTLKMTLRTQMLKIGMAMTIQTKRAGTQKATPLVLR